VFSVEDVYALVQLSSVGRLQWLSSEWRHTSALDSWFVHCNTCF